jgi:basic membrane protein A and related proteins
MVDQRRRSRPSGASRALRPTSLVALIALLAAACGGAAPSASAPVASAPAASEPAASPASPAAQTVKVFGAFATEIEEPWDGVIHSALEAEKAAGRVDYSFQDAIGYSGDMERVLREVAERDQPAVIFGDAFGNEEAARRVAAEYPEIAFVFGSGGGPAEPNFSVFDNWIHEPAYLAGMLAGGLTKSNTLGVVGGYPVPEVNRIVNAFIGGAKEVNPNVEVKVTFLNSWFDPAAAKEAALAQVGAGADVLFAERFGVIEAASENDLVAIGNMSDQKELAPQNVVSSVTWNMKPTVAYVIDQVMAGAYTAQDLKDFSMVGKGGAALAEINTSVGGGVPADLVTKVQEKESAIKSGTFRVDINDATPPGATVPAG